MLYINYLQKKTLNQFLSIATILISLIWFSRAISFMKYITNNGISIADFIYLFILILPWLLIFIIPISLFIAVLLVYYNLLKSNEISILKNTGLSKIRIGKPAITLAIIITIFSYILSFYIMPLSNKELRRIKLDFANNYASLAFKADSFETINNLTIYIKKKDKNNQLYGVMINDKRSLHNSITITAQFGNVIIKENSVYLILKNGTVQRYNYKKKNSEILRFDNYIYNLTDNKNNLADIKWKAKEKYFHELFYFEDNISQEEYSKIQSEIHERITYPIMSIVLTLLAITCILCKEFSRRDNAKNIFFTVLLAILYMFSMIMIYDLIEVHSYFAILLYLIIIFCIMFCCKLLSDSNIKKRQ